VHTLSPVLLAYVAVSVFLAGIVRGATGFGFSMIMIVLLTLVYAPAEVVPVILLWEVLASVGHLPFVYRQVDWKSLRWLALGVLAGTPVGVNFLVNVPPEPMRIVINAVVLALTVMLFWGFYPRKSPTPGGTIGIGVLSGVINGASANGGPPVILFFLSSPAGSAVGRASLIVFFLFTDVFASFFYWQKGMIDGNTLYFTAVFLLPLGLGMLAGSRLFAAIDEKRFNAAVLCLLMAISVIALVRSVMALGVA
jgi:uncharacterized membrane protein YfcA